MPDTNINLLVKVSGQAELNSLIDKIKGGTASQYDIEKAAKLSEKTFKSLRGTLDKEVEPAIRKMTVALREMKTQGMEPVTTAQGKMMKSYFSTGEELRRFYREQRVGDRTMREATQTITGFGNMLGGEGLGKIVGGAAARFQEMEFAVTGLGIAGQSAGGKFAGLGATLTAVAGPVAAVAAVIGVLAMALDGANKITERMKKSFDDLMDSLIAGGKISKQAQIDMLTKQINVAGRDQYSPSAFASIVGGGALAEEQLAFYNEREKKIQDLMNKRAALEKSLEDERIKAREEEIKLGKELTDINSDFLDATEKTLEVEVKRTAEKKKQNDLLRDELDFYAKGARGLGLRTGLGGIDQYAKSDIKGFKNIGLKDAPAGAKLSTADEAINYLKNYNKELSIGEQAVVGLADGVSNLQGQWTQAVSGLIMGTQNIGQAFQSMGRMVVAALAEIIAKMIAMKILSTLLSFIPGFGGGGGSIVDSLTDSRAGGGGSVITQMSNSQMGRIPTMGGGYGSSQSIQFPNVIARLENDAIVLAVERGKNQRRGRIG